MVALANADQPLCEEEAHDDDALEDNNEDSDAEVEQLTPEVVEQEGNKKEKQMEKQRPKDKEKAERENWKQEGATEWEYKKPQKEVGRKGSR